jgi:hypothetical protein
VKVRTGGPVDDEEDLSWPVWAGHVPCRVVYDVAVTEPLGEPVPVPDAVEALSR